VKCRGIGETTSWDLVVEIEYRLIDIEGGDIFTAYTYAAPSHPAAATSNSKKEEKDIALPAQG
ncbi:hypothetical protein, partial [Vibrio parahaemolyticus]|uniref:hypothetical protein n=1 Tax=Vibrio parahaemolyticus TaxID=670 RepID=UPI003C7B71B6